MFSEKFQKFIEIWQQDFAVERSIDEKVCVDRDGRPVPWYTYPAIEYLAQFDYADKKIFEYGCGYSSAFWAERAAGVVSVEDKEEWFDKWQREFGYANLDIRRRDENEDYENAIFEDGLKYDVIAIDGKRREKCAAAAVRALAAGGAVILDDSDRACNSGEYRNAAAELKRAGLIQVDFFGFCPMNCYPKTTSLFLSRDFDFLPKGGVQPAAGRGSLWSKQRKMRKDFFKKFG